MSTRTQRMVKRLLRYAYLDGCKAIRVKVTKKGSVIVTTERGSKYIYHHG